MSNQVPVRLGIWTRFSCLDANFCELSWQATVLRLLWSLPFAGLNLRSRRRRPEGPASALLSAVLVVLPGHRGAGIRSCPDGSRNRWFGEAVLFLALELVRFVPGCSSGASWLLVGCLFGLRGVFCSLGYMCWPYVCSVDVTRKPRQLTRRPLCGRTQAKRTEWERGQFR